MIWIVALVYGSVSYFPWGVFRHPKTFKFQFICRCLQVVIVILSLALYYNIDYGHNTGKVMILMYQFSRAIVILACFSINIMNQIHGKRIQELFSMNELLDGKIAVFAKQSEKYLRVKYFTYFACGLLTVCLFHWAIWRNTYSIHRSFESVALNVVYSNMHLANMLFCILVYVGWYNFQTITNAIQNDSEYILTAFRSGDFNVLDTYMDNVNMMQHVMKIFSVSTFFTLCAYPVSIMVNCYFVVYYVFEESVFDLPFNPIIPKLATILYFSINVIVTTVICQCTVEESQRSSTLLRALALSQDSSNIIRKVRVIVLYSFMGEILETLFIDFELPQI